MTMPTAEFMPRESFFTGRLAGRSKSASRSAARPPSQFGKSMEAALSASLIRKWSG
jgi:hypothetical protein